MDTSHTPHRPLRFCALAVFCALTGFASPARAASGRALALPELVARSEATVLAHPIGQSSFWQGSRIVTRVEVRADEVWDGGVQPGDVLAVYTLGGVVGEIGQRVDGAAALPSYGRVVLHLQRIEGGYTPTAMAQGLWLVDGLYGEQAPVRAQSAALGLLPSAPQAGSSYRIDTLRALRDAVRKAARVKAK